MSVRSRKPGHAARSHNERIAAMEKRTTFDQTNPQPGWVYWEKSFSMHPLAVNTSGRYHPPFTGELYEAVASLKSATSGTTTILVQVNGGTQATITLAGTDQFEKAVLNDILQADIDYATVETTAIGVAAGLVVTLRFRRRA